MSPPDPATKQLMDAIFADKVQRARQRPIDQKILDGPRLFDECCELMRGGIRTQFPNFTDEQVEQELRRRLALKRQIDEAGIYRPIEDTDE